MIKHLQEIYSKSQLLSTDEEEPLNQLKFNKQTIILSNDTVLCIISFPIVKPIRFKLNKIHPLIKENTILLIPSVFMLKYETLILWYSNCAVVDKNQYYCSNQVKTNVTELSMSPTIYIQNYEEIQALRNGTLLMTTTNHWIINNKQYGCGSYLINYDKITIINQQLFEKETTSIRKEEVQLGMVTLQTPKEGLLKLSNYPQDHREIATLLQKIEKTPAHLQQLTFASHAAITTLSFVILTTLIATLCLKGKIKSVLLKRNRHRANEEHGRELTSSDLCPYL
ncbi:uncharacterized protein LOC112905295 [Agrilus planipennis]|uniref:Uncharacterized protein LOC112905295 n=1 Tax=Agrilus planipennis TaxID=224129 RepID=A0A7F5RB51_AGRPL|nr:uncharacterized protein LOC112905295 [Agrilus planipennis]